MPNEAEQEIKEATLEIDMWWPEAPQGRLYSRIRWVWGRGKRRSCKCEKETNVKDAAQRAAGEDGDEHTD